MSRFNLREDLMNRVLNDPETLVDKWYTPSPGVVEYFNQTRLPCYKPTPCRSQIKCCTQCRYGKKPDPTKHVFHEPAEPRGCLYLKVFPWTRFQTAYTCRLTDYIREKNLMRGGMEGPVFLRQIEPNLMMMYLTHEYPIVKLTLDEDNVITDMELAEWGSRLNDRAIPELKDFLNFQLIFPHEGEK